MWARMAAISSCLLGGCAQLAGIDNTKLGAIDAPAIDMPVIDGPPADAAPCAGGDVRVTDPTSGACYVFFVAPLDREQARVACEGLGAPTTLVSIQSAAENLVVKQLIGNNLAFLGATDVVTEGVYLWPDNSALTFLNFNAGEPNNGMGQVPGGEDCLVMHGELNGTWDDRPCAPVAGIATPGAYSYVCERD